MNALPVPGCRNRLAVYSFLVFAAACVAYFNAWPDTLVLDDISFARHERFGDYSAIGSYFLENAWAVLGLESDLYRPLLMVSITLDAYLFGDWFAGYHLVNIFWHAAVSLLVFAFIAKLLRLDGADFATGRFAAFLAALIFAVHPAHTEAVNSVFNRSALMAAFAVLGGLWWLLHHHRERPLRAWAGVTLAYLFALFCRESAIAMPGMAAVVVFAYSEGTIGRRFGRTLPVLLLLLPLLLYLRLRGIALAGADVQAGQSTTVMQSALGDFSAGRLLSVTRLLEIAGTWLQGLYLLAWPFDLRVSYHRLPKALHLAGLLVHFGLLLWGLFMYRRGRKGFLVALAICYLALLPSSRPFWGSAIPAIQLRYLYLAAVGMAVLLGYGFSFLVERFDRLLAAAPVVLLLAVLVPTTWARNAEWSNELELYESEYRKGRPTGYLLRFLTAAYLEREDFSRVVAVCDENPGIQSADGIFATHCASALNLVGRLADAEKAYLEGTRHGKSRRLAHSNLAQFYLSHGRWDEARVHFEQAIETERNPGLKAYHAGIMLLHLYPDSRAKRIEARMHFEEALRLRPGLQAAETWLAHINEALGETP